MTRKGTDRRFRQAMEICLALPEAERRAHADHDDCRVRGRVFAYLLNDHHGDGIVSVCCKAAPGENADRVRRDPVKFYRPAHIGARGWIGLRLDRREVDWPEVVDLVGQSYRLVAPKSLAGLLDGRKVTTRPRRQVAPGPVAFEDVRQVAAALPGVEEASSYGTRALKVRGKLLARVHQNLDCLVLRCNLLDRQILLQSAPDVFFVTDHYRDYPWVLVRFATLDRRALPDLLERAWREVAPASLAAKHGAGR